MMRRIAGQHVDELIEEFHVERDHGLRCWLLELIRGGPVGPRVRPADDSCTATTRCYAWAVRGLELLDTREAWRVLWQ